jgi:hypothetical protein
VKQLKFTIHPFANFFPMIEGKAFEKFAEDIKVNGQREPILIIRKPGQIQIVDGRNRHKACLLHGITPKFEEWNGKGDLLALVMSLNLRRRHLTSLQRAAAVVPYKKHLAKEAAKRSKAGKPLLKITQGSVGRASQIAAEVAESSATYVDIAEKAFDESPELYAEIINDKITYAQARVRLSKKTRSRSISVKVSLPTDCKIIVGDAIKEMDRLPANSVRVIFADPPYNNKWKYDGDVTQDDLPAGEYLDWCQSWMASATRLLTEDGSLFVLIDDNWSDHFGIILRRLGLHRRNTIIWWEHFPQHTNGNFTRAARFIHYYTKSPKKFIWQPERIESGRQKVDDPRA